MRSVTRLFHLLSGQRKKPEENDRFRKSRHWRMYHQWYLYHRMVIILFLIPFFSLIRIKL